MEKKQIPLIVFAVFSIVILLTQNNIDKVYADQVIIYSVTGNAIFLVDNGGRITAGMELTASSSLIGLALNTVKIPLRNGGFTADGTLHVGVWDSTITPTIGNALHIFGTISASTLTNSILDYTVTGLEYTLTANDFVGFFYDYGAGAGSVESLVRTSNQFDGVNTYDTRFDEPTSTWVDTTGQDAGMTLSLITGSDTRVCIDTTGDGETDVCFIDTNGDGVPDAGVGGALAVYRGTANATKFGTDLGCAFGITSCTNKDIKTNGVGLFYLMIIIVWSYAMLVFIHFEAKKMSGAGNVHLTEIMNINPILLVVMLLVDVGITFYLGWIPDLIFYSTIVGVIGLSAFGLYRHFKG